MPVFTRLKDGILEVVVDGDYTSDELRRKGAAAIEDPETPTPIPVLLDMSGAAGMHKKGMDDFRATGDFFAARKELMTRVALLAPNDLLYGLMNQGSVFASSAGLESRPFRTKSEALDWLALAPGPEAGSGE